MTSTLDFLLAAAIVLALRANIIMYDNSFHYHKDSPSEANRSCILAFIIWMTRRLLLPTRKSRLLKEVKGVSLHSAKFLAAVTQHFLNTLFTMGQLQLQEEDEIVNTITPYHMADYIVTERAQQCFYKLIQKLGAEIDLKLPKSLPHGEVYGYDAKQ
jgi:hypothetical protein